MFSSTPELQIVTLETKLWVLRVNIGQVFRHNPDGIRPASDCLPKEGHSIRVYFWNHLRIIYPRITTAILSQENGASIFLLTLNKLFYAGAWAACSPVPHRVHSPQCLWAATQAVWGKASQETGAWRRSGSWALWGLTAGAGSWRVCVCVCVCVRARMLVGVLKSGVLVKESGLLGSVWALLLNMTLPSYFTSLRLQGRKTTGQVHSSNR